jgi:hypothetical protein
VAPYHLGLKGTLWLKLRKDPESYGGQRLILATPKPASNRLNENQQRKLGMEPNLAP